MTADGVSTAMPRGDGSTTGGHRAATAERITPDGAKAICESWSAIFEHELAAWSTDQATRPKLRTLKLFRDRFDVTFSAIVVDLGRGRIEVDED